MNIPSLGAGLSLTALLAAAPANAQTVTVTGTSGPHPVLREEGPGLSSHTLYRPADLSKVPGRMPVVTFGNGACANVGNAFEAFVAELASHGYLVTVPGRIEPGWIPAEAGGPPTPQSPPGQMVKALDWAEREAARVGGPYRGKLDPGRVGAVGISCGGLEAIAAGADRRFKTVMVFNTGTGPAGEGRRTVPAGNRLPATPEDLARLKVPVAYLVGGSTDHARLFADADFDRLKDVPVFNASIEAGHRGTWRQPRGGEMGRVAIKWLDWRLKNDRQAQRMFAGRDCGLCRDPLWVVKRKNMP